MKFTAIWDHLSYPNELRILDLVFMIKFLTVHAPKEALLFLTSEENSYGATLGQWFDGKVDPFILENTTEHFLTFELQEYQHLQDQCQEQSYYQCIAPKLVENTKCEGKNCTWYTLPDPHMKFKDVQECQETTETSFNHFYCKSKLLHDLFYNDSICKSVAEKDMRHPTVQRRGC